MRHSSISVPVMGDRCFCTYGRRPVRLLDSGGSTYHPGYRNADTLGGTRVLVGVDHNHHWVSPVRSFHYTNRRPADDV